MANLNIAFSPGLAGVGSYLLPALATPVTVANVTVSGVSTQSAAAPAGTLIARISADTPCYVVVGVNPTATASTGVFIPTFGVTHVSIIAGQKIAVIA